MLPDHVRANGEEGWVMLSEPRPDGMTLAAAAAEPRQVAIPRAWASSA
jgi:hypothetical protein